MKFEYIDEIVEQLLSNTFSVFCGAGATMDATKRSWEKIFSAKTQEFYQQNCSNDIYFLADLEKHYYNSNFLNDIKQAISIPKETESGHINSIIDLNINQIWTTNFDQIIEHTIVRRLGLQPTIIKNSNDLFKNSLSAPYIIYKLNGSIEDLSTMVLTKSDFFDYFKKQRLLFEMLKRQLVLDTFMFVGYSFRDDLVLNALREIKEVFPEKGKQHYRFSPQSSTTNETQRQFSRYEEKYFQDRYNIKTIHLQSYDDIDIYLKEIYRRYCNHNVFICGSFRYISNDERIIIEALVDQLIARLFANGFRVYSGNGRGLGEIVVARANKYRTHRHGELVNRPLIFMGDSTEQKKLKNRLIMKDCNTMIIICGQDDTLGSSENVYAQFQQFLNEENDPLIIPIPCTGYAAKQIFYSEDFTASSCFRANIPVFNKIKDCEDSSELCRLIVNLISSYRDEPTV